MFSCEFCEIYKSTFGGCIWKHYTHISCFSSFLTYLSDIFNLVKFLTKNCIFSSQRMSWWLNLASHWVAICFQYINLILRKKRCVHTKTRSEEVTRKNRLEDNCFLIHLEVAGNYLIPLRLYSIHLVFITTFGRHWITTSYKKGFLHNKQ